VESKLRPFGILGENLSERHFVYHKFHLTRFEREPGPPRWEAIDQPLELWRNPNKFLREGRFKRNISCVAWRELIMKYRLVIRWSTFIIRTHSLTEPSPSWKAASCAATRELPSILWNPKVHCRVHNNPPLVPILSYINPIHTIPSYLSKVKLSLYRPWRPLGLREAPTFSDIRLINVSPTRRPLFTPKNIPGTHFC
jgi:hypothetical protein